MPSFMVYVGTYNAPGSDGIFVYQLDGSTGTLTLVGSVAGIVNPSFLTISADRRFLYAVNEVTEFNGQPGGGLTAFEIDPRSGLLNRLNSQSTGGTNPCYVSTEAGLVFVANYGGGNLAVLPIDRDGHLGGLLQVLQHQGASINPHRQHRPHVHSAVVDPAARYVLATDLGIDKILVYRLDHSQIPLVKVHEVAVEAGSGPRHLSFHPNGRFLYLATELSSTVTAFAYNQLDGTLHTLQMISTLPGDFAGANITADIHVAPSGLYLYVSNRGHDSLAIFAIDQSTGQLSSVDFMPTQGRTPRNFAFDPTGSWLLVANQNSDTLVQFKVDQGHLTPTEQVITIPKPTCIKVISLDQANDTNFASTKFMIPS